MTRRILGWVCCVAVLVTLAACAAQTVEPSVEATPSAPTATPTRSLAPTFTPSPTVEPPQPTETSAVPVSGVEVFIPSADTFVDSSRPDENFGNANELDVGIEQETDSGEQQGERRILLRFDVSGIPEGAIVRSARLRLWVQSPTYNDRFLHAVAGEWEENTVTWTTAPAMGDRVATFTNEIFLHHWDEVNLEHIVTGNERYDFFVTMAERNAAAFRSREDRSAPQLIVEWSTDMVVRSLPDPAMYTTDPPVLVGAGDVASCDSERDEATAELIEQIPGAVFVTGDTVYTEGTPEEFRSCYEPSWGRFRDRTFPSPGDHEYNTPGAAGYFQYFGPAAGDPDKGYYSYDLGEWHIIVLNTNCREAGGCGEDSPQAEWLRTDLLANASQCMLAYWHEPRFSLRNEGNIEQTDYFWQILYEHGTELVLNGDEHYYVRFAPQNPEGEADPLGIRQFTVGTGGRTRYEFEADLPNVEVRDNTSYGVLKLTLHPDRYDWEFIHVDIPLMTFTDSGSEACH